MRKTNPSPILAPDTSSLFAQPPPSLSIVQAYTNVLKRMLEASGRGMWDAKPEVCRRRAGVVQKRGGHTHEACRRGRCCWRWGKKGMQRLQEGQAELRHAPPLPRTYIPYHVVLYLRRLQVVSKLRELFNEMDDELEGVTGPGRSG